MIINVNIRMTPSKATYPKLDCMLDELVIGMTIPAKFIAVWKTIAARTPPLELLWNHVNEIVKRVAITKKNGKYWVSKAFPSPLVKKSGMCQQIHIIPRKMLAFTAVYLEV